MSEDVAVVSYPNELRVHYAHHVHNRCATIILRYTDQPSVGTNDKWNIQKFYSIDYKFYQRMYKLMGEAFEVSLKQMLATQDGQQLDQKLAKDEGFFPVDFEGQAAHTEYFKTKYDHPQSPNSWKIKRELHYSEKGKEGIEQLFDLPYEDSRPGSAYLSGTIKWKHGKKHGPENYYMPWELTFFKSTTRPDLWHSLREEGQRLHALLPELLPHELESTFYSSDNDPTYQRPENYYEPIQALTFSVNNFNDQWNGVRATWHNNSQLYKWGEWEAGGEDDASQPIGDHYEYDRNGTLREITSYPEKPEMVAESFAKGITYRRPRILYRAQFDENGHVIFAATYGPNNVKCIHTYLAENISPFSFDPDPKIIEGSQIDDDLLPF